MLIIYIKEPSIYSHVAPVVCGNANSFGMSTSVTPVQWTEWHSFSRGIQNWLDKEVSHQICIYVIWMNGPFKDLRKTQEGNPYLFRFLFAGIQPSINLSLWPLGASSLQ